MLIYLSKKIAIPNNTKLNCIAWNKESGYIAVGGNDGLLKVLKLDGSGDAEAGMKTKGLTAASNLSMNQTLEGHTDSIKVITWNETHQKLTSSDNNGVIIVWMMYKGVWYEEMINNRKKSTVIGMSWNSDGLKVCIIYEDGAVIVGSVDGNRIWAKELKTNLLCGVQWSPDGKLLLFSLQNGQVHLYDCLGNFAMKLEIICLEPTGSEVPVVGLDWYDGKYGHLHALCPSLAICYENGRLQLMCNENDTNPIIVDTGMIAVCCKWNHNGSLIAVAGKQIEEDRHSNAVQFYSAFGDHLRTLKVPGSSISSCAWEGGSLRIALAIDSFVYFANIRPDYKWCYFKRTIVFTSCRPQKAEICVSFWDTSNNQCHTKYVPVLKDVAGFGDHCVLVTASENDDNTRQCGLLLCNTLGTLVDAIYVDIDVQWITMNGTHVTAASKDNFIIWQYKTPKFSTVIGNRFKCKMYHIDDDQSGAAEVLQDLEQKLDSPVNTHSTKDPICSIASSNKVLVIGRESGMLQHYALPHVTLFNRFKMASRPHKMAINCNASSVSVIDVSGILTVLDISEGIGHPTVSSDNKKLERKDVWAMCWASDNPQLLAIMEKTRMYIFKGNNPEEPIASSGYICSFQDLEVQAVLLDEIMETPNKPNKEHLIKLEVKSLRDTRQLLEKVGIKEAAQFIEDNPHPRLWRLLAEAALKRLNLPMAESAFIRSYDYAGILFVKKMQNINCEIVTKAYIATYFKQFDEAEKMYIESDRCDLALSLRQTLGDWFRVMQILKNDVVASDLVLEVAQNSAAEYFAQFNNWAAAVEYFELAKNRIQMVECYYHLEDYEKTLEIIQDSNEGDGLLKQIGDMYAADGVQTIAVEAYTKFGDIKSAIDLCILHNKWDQAKDLAKKYDIPEIFTLFTKHTIDLVDQKLLASAIELNVQTKNYLDAAHITLKLAEGESKKTNKDAMILKKLYVYVARLIEHFAKVKRIRDASITENIWDGAEAYHLYILAHDQLYHGNIHGAMLTAFQLKSYTDYINDVEVYCLLALTSYLDESYSICSKAMVQIKLIEELSEAEIENFTKIELEIFRHHDPKDIRCVRKSCFNCQESVPDWSTICPSCSVQYTVCIASGQSLIEDTQLTWVCEGCHHSALNGFMTTRTTCPLCHINISQHTN